jgi:hypothetical protein
MSRILVCKYSASVEIKVPEALARQIDAGLPIHTDWACLEVTDKNGIEYKIEGDLQEPDYSFCTSFDWKEPELDVRALILEAKVRRLKEKADATRASQRKFTKSLSESSESMSSASSHSSCQSGQSGQSGQSESDIIITNPQDIRLIVTEIDNIPIASSPLRSNFKNE